MPPGGRGRGRGVCLSVESLLSFLFWFVCGTQLVAPSTTVSFPTVSLARKIAMPVPAVWSFREVCILGCLHC